MGGKRTLALARMVRRLAEDGFPFADYQKWLVSLTGAAYPTTRVQQHFGCTVTREECREVARDYFAVAVKSNSADERERAIVQGEEWMAHWRFWGESKATLRAPTFEETPADPVMPYRY